MTQLLIGRIFNGLITLFVVITLTFILMRLMPGGPFDEERVLPPEIQANLEAKYHLDKPVHVQYGYYLGDLIKGDLGPSYKYKSRRVNDIVGDATVVSFKLGLLALFFGTLLGVAFGTVAGLTRIKWLDALLTLLGASSISMPSFIFGGLLVLTLSLSLGWLPAATLETPAHYVLPVTALALVPFAYSFLLIRTSVRETQTLPYVHIKKSYGLKDNVLAVKHVLRNSLIPLFSILGPMAAAIITGSFAVEFIFAVPGLGKHFVTAVTNRDYTLVMGITIVYSVALIIFNTATDLVYGYLDPRLRHQGGES